MIPGVLWYVIDEHVEKFVFDTSYEAKIRNQQSEVKADKKQKLKLKISNTY